MELQTHFSIVVNIAAGEVVEKAKYFYGIDLEETQGAEILTELTGEISEISERFLEDRIHRRLRLINHARLLDLDLELEEAERKRRKEEKEAPKQDEYLKDIMKKD